MATITFDTLKFVETLRAHGLPEEQAKGVAEAFRDAQQESELNVQDGIRGDLNANALRLESKMAEMEFRLESKMAEMKIDLIKWVAGALIAQAAVVATLVKLL